MLAHTYTAEEWGGQENYIMWREFYDMMFTFRA